MGIFNFLDNHNKSAIFLAMAMGVILPSNASAESVSIESLNQNRDARNLCITKRSSNIRYKKCDGKSPQRFEISGSDQSFKITRKGKCIVAEIKANLDDVKSDIRKNVKIRIGSCNPSNPDILETGTIDGLVYTNWRLDRGYRLRSINSIGTLDICLADGDKNDKIKASGCKNSSNPGRWQIISAN